MESSNSIVPNTDFFGKYHDYNHNSQNAEYIFNENGTFKRKYGKTNGIWKIKETILELNYQGGSFVCFNWPFKFGNNNSILECQSGWKSKKCVTIKIN